MTSAGRSCPSADRDAAWSPRKVRLTLLAIFVVFLALRLPPMWRQPGRIDEELNAVPVLTILRTGLPQLPQLPSRNPRSMFYRADEVLYTEPPLYYYLQALLYCILPATYGTARLGSAAAAVGMLCLTHALARRWTGHSAAATWTTALFAASRWLFYPATIARPDMLCAMFGLCAIWSVCRWREDERLRWLMWTGAFIGVGGLTHPLAIVYAVQIAVWLFVVSRGWRRVARPALVATVSLGVVSLWLTLILIDPELFRVQFNNQFIAAGSGGALSWLSRPAASLAYHARWFWLNMYPGQCLLIGVPWLVCFQASQRGDDRNMRLVCHLGWSSFVLMSLAVGTHHDVPGYWAYPAVYGFVCAGWLIDRAGQAAARRWGRPAGGAVLASLAVACCAILLPGSGLKLFATYVRNWNDVNYNAPAFARRLMDQIPADAACTVDHEFVLDFLAAGRPVLGIPTSPIYLNAEDYPYDYLVVSRYGLRKESLETYCSRFESSEGVRGDELACYAELHRPSPTPCDPAPHSP